MNRRFGQFTHQLWAGWPSKLRLAVSLALLIGIGACASHGPAPVVVTPPKQNLVSSRSSEDFSLKLVTYNIWGLPSWMTGARPGRYPRIARELERLDADIILLQEAWTGEARTSAPSNGNWAIARAAGQHTFFQQCGLMTLSKLPIVGGKFYPFSRAAFPDCFVQKGALKVTVELQPGLLLNIWNVHLQDGASEVRESQIRQLISWVRGAEDKQVADIVGGDFNSTPTSPLFQELESSIGPSVLQLGQVEPFVTWDDLSTKPGAGETLDHIFIRSRAGIQSLKATQQSAFTAADKSQRLSDHLGLESLVNFSCAKSLASSVGPQLQSAMLR